MAGVRAGVHRTIRRKSPSRRGRQSAQCGVQSTEEREVELIEICTNIDVRVREACQRRYIHTRSGGLGCRRRKEVDKAGGQVQSRMEMTEAVKSRGENGGGHD